MQTLVAPGIRPITRRAIGALPDVEFDQWFRGTGGAAFIPEAVGRARRSEAASPKHVFPAAAVSKLSRTLDQRGVLRIRRQQRPLIQRFATRRGQ